MGQIARIWSGGRRASTRETLMLVFLVDRARSTVDREGLPEALDIGKYILEYRYIIFRPAARRGSKTCARSLLRIFYDNTRRRAGVITGVNAIM